MIVCDRDGYTVIDVIEGDAHERGIGTEQTTYVHRRPARGPRATSPERQQENMTIGHLRVLIVNERDDRIALTTGLMAELGHEVVVGSTNRREPAPRTHRGLLADV
jgi:hypothetical protein